jgi:hypothetical protein
MQMPIVIRKPKIHKFWELDRDGVTQSLLAKWLQCPERARLAYIEGFSSIYLSKHLEFGSLVHEVLDRIYTSWLLGKQADSPIDLQVYVKNGLTIQKSKDQERINSLGIQSQDAVDMLEENYAIAEPTLSEYFAHWQSDWGRFEWVGLEEKFNMPFETPFSDKPIYLRGKFDGIMRLGGKLWLFETKTKSRIEEEDIVDKLGFDLQVCMYLYALEKIYGERPKGVIYNIMRRSSVRRDKDMSLIAYSNKIREDIKKRREFYFMRYECSMTDDDREKWLKNFNGMMQAFIAWTKGENQFQNHMSCSGQFGRCEFLNICGKSDVTFYKKRPLVFPELDGE